MPHEVIMPALGMAQDTGVIIAWHKALGDPVAKGDLLMEVETDKAVAEVEAQTDGWLTEIHAGDGEEVPVGQVIALIGASSEDVGSDQKPSQVPESSRVEAPESPMPSNDKQSPTPAFSADKRILASPKARRLAVERGIDLCRLAASGHPQPFHVADLEAADKLPVRKAGRVSLSARARVPGSEFHAFLDWLEQETGQSSTSVLASFASGAFRGVTGAKRLVVLSAAPQSSPISYIDPDHSGLKTLEPSVSKETPDLFIHDLSKTRLTELDLGTAEVPTFCTGRSGDLIETSLTVAEGTLTEDQLISCLDAFAGRVEEPLRHLL